MATITGLTALRMLAIEASSVVSGLVNGASRLILTKYDGTTIDAGYVKGDTGVTGQTGQTGPQGIPGPVVTGLILMYGSVTPPSGYLSCNGAAVSRTTYSALFAVIGTTYGVGDGTTTFLLPNLASKFPRGNTPGSTGGSDTHGHANTFAQTDHSHLGVDHLHSQSGHTHVVNAHSHALSDVGWANLSIFAAGGIYLRRITGSFINTYRSTSTTAVPLTADATATATAVGLGGVTNTDAAYWTNGQTSVVNTGAMDRGATTGGASTNAITGAVTNGSNIPAFAGVNFIIKT